MSQAASLPQWMLRVKVEDTPLTPREKAVLRELAMGYSQTEIAERSGRSRETIRKQTKVARARLGARTNTQAVAIAVSLDLI